MMKIKPLILALSLSFAPYIGYSLPSDNQAKLYISARTVQINRTTGIGIYEGDVVIDRGTTHVLADKLTTYSDKKNHLIEAIAEGKNGKLAQYSTLPAQNKPTLLAKAQTIKYYPDKHYVILLNQASVIQGDNSISGEHLEYNLQTQYLVTKTSNNPGGRTMIVLQPNNL